jgi:signal peptidase I
MRFSEILVIATVVTGVIWALDTFFLRPKRMMYVLKDKTNQSGNEPWWVEYARSFFPILLIVLILRSFLAEPFRIPSGSMRPTLLEGDFIVVNKYIYGLRLPIVGYNFFKISEPKRGDIIVFKHVKNGESIDMIKRVIGLPGEHVQYKDQTIYINGEAMKKNFHIEKDDINPQGAKTPVRVYTEQLESVNHTVFVHPNMAQYLSHYPYTDVTVPAGSYFVMGDNRDNSEDSRVWGFVKNEDIQGKAFAIWMSWEGSGSIPFWELGKKIRWDRLMTAIQ